MDVRSVKNFVDRGTSLQNNVHLYCQQSIYKFVSRVRVGGGEMRNINETTCPVDIYIYIYI